MTAATLPSYGTNDPKAGASPRFRRVIASVGGVLLGVFLLSALPAMAGEGAPPNPLGLPGLVPWNPASNQFWAQARAQAEKERHLPKPALPDSTTRQPAHSQPPPPPPAINRPMPSFAPSPWMEQNRLQAMRYQQWLWERQRRQFLAHPVMSGYRNGPPPLGQYRMPPRFHGPVRGRNGPRRGAPPPWRGPGMSFSFCGLFG